jgi:hypothetical protein
MSEIRNKLSGDFAHKVEELNRVTAVLVGGKTPPSNNALKLVLGVHLWLSWLLRLHRFGCASRVFNLS